MIEEMKKDIKALKKENADIKQQLDDQRLRIDSLIPSLQKGLSDCLNGKTEK